MCDSVRCALSGAATDVGYALAYMIARGEVFGKDTSVILHMLDAPDKINLLDATSMELQDCLMPTLKQVIPTSDPTVAFIAATCAFLIGNTSEQAGVERKDRIAEDLKSFRAQGQALNTYACKDVKVVVIGIGANTNALIASHYSPTIPRENFTALTRLHQNRAMGILSDKLRVPARSINNVVVWGNNSSTIYPDAGSATIQMCEEQCCVAEALDDDVYLQAQFISQVQKREADISEKRKSSAAMSMAQSACDHMRDVWYGTPEGVIVSMGVISDGSYCIPKDIVFSFPVEVQDGNIQIVGGLALDDFAKAKIAATAKELVEEKAEVVNACKLDASKKNDSEAEAECKDMEKEED